MKSVHMSSKFCCDSFPEFLSYPIPFVQINNNIRHKRLSVCRNLKKKQKITLQICLLTKIALGLLVSTRRSAVSVNPDDLSCDVIIYMSHVTLLWSGRSTFQVYFLRYNCARPNSHTVKHINEKYKSYFWITTFKPCNPKK